LELVHHIAKFNRLQRFEDIRGGYALVLLGLGDAVCAKRNIFCLKTRQKRGIFGLERRNKAYVAANNKTSTTSQQHKWNGQTQEIDKHR
jgi:hypothetical protein